MAQRRLARLGRVALLFCFLATASAASGSARKAQKKKATTLQSAGAALPLAGLQTASNVAVVVYAPPSLSGQLKCEALVESIRSQGKWGGRLYLITEQLKCYQHERWTQCGLDAEIIALDDSFHEDDASHSTSTASSSSSATSPNPNHPRHHGSLYRWWLGVLGPSPLDLERARLVRSQLWQLLQPPASVQALVYMHGCDQLVGGPLMPFIKQATGAFKTKKSLFGARGPRPMLVVSPPAAPAPAVPSAAAATATAATGRWSPFFDSAFDVQQQPRVQEAAASSSLLLNSGSVMVLSAEEARRSRRVGDASGQDATTASAATQQPQRQQQEGQEQEAQQSVSEQAVGRGTVWVLHRQHSAGLLQAWRETVREHHRRRDALEQQQQGRRFAPRAAALREGAEHLLHRRAQEEEEERGLLEAAVAKAWAKQQRVQPSGSSSSAGAAVGGGGSGGQQEDVCMRAGPACVARYVKRVEGWSRTLGCEAQEGCDMTVAPAVFNYVPASICDQYDHEMVTDWVTTLDLCVVQDLGWCLPAHMAPFAKGWLPYPQCAKMELGLSRVSCQWSCTEPTVVRSPGFRTSVIARTLTWP